MGKLMTAAAVLDAAIDFELMAYCGADGAKLARASVASLMAAARQQGYAAFARCAARQGISIELTLHVLRLARYPR